MCVSFRTEAYNDMRIVTAFFEVVFFFVFHYAVLCHLATKLVFFPLRFPFWSFSLSGILRFVSFLSRMTSFFASHLREWDSILRGAFFSFSVSRNNYMYVRTHRRQSLEENSSRQGESTGCKSSTLLTKGLFRLFPLIFAPRHTHELLAAVAKITCERRLALDKKGGCLNSTSTSHFGGVDVRKGGLFCTRTHFYAHSFRAFFCRRRIDLRVGWGGPR